MRRRSSREETRHRIVVCALERFRCHGLANASIAQIAEQLRMTPGNVYRHFASKQQLRDAVCEHLLDRAIDQLRPVLEADAPADIRLRTFVFANLRHNEQSIYADPHILDMIRCSAIENWPSFQKARLAFFEAMRGIIRDGVADGVFRIGDDDDSVRTVLLSLSAAMHPLLRHEVPSQSVLPVSARLVDLVLSAIRT